MAAKWEAEQYHLLISPMAYSNLDLSTWLRIPQSNILLLLGQVALPKTAGHSDILEV